MNGNVEKLKEYLGRKGIDWLVAAMIDGSIGYHSPGHANRLIELALHGETVDCCERCIACYEGDLLKMIFSDIRKMEYLENHNPEKVKRLLKVVNKIEKMSVTEQMTASLMYPTLNI